MGLESALWPYDPLEGPEIRGRAAAARIPGRRTGVEASARAVRAGLGALAASADRQAGKDGPWKRGIHGGGGRLRSCSHSSAWIRVSLRVELPAHISASLLVELGDDPQAVTRQLRRPVPRQPGMAARKGTAFHAWVEEYFGRTGQLELDELPGADSHVDQAYGLDAMQETFRASEWAQRSPAFIEVPVETRVGDVVVRGRIDAVFRDVDGGWDLIDWKTGSAPTAAKLGVRSVQLALYRLAWSRLKDVPLESVRAAFYYVGQDKLIRPHDLAGESELEAIVSAAYEDSAAAPDPTR